MTRLSHLKQKLAALCVVGLATVNLLSVADVCHADNQTEDVSPVLTGGLPYGLNIDVYDFGDAGIPALHSFAKAQHDGLWLLIAGRTNGLHGFGDDGLENFPPSHQNRDVWVIDPVAGQSWQRSLTDVSSGLTTTEVDSLSVTNNQFYQQGDHLYMTGGYGFSTDDNFGTFDELTSIDVPGLIDWTQGGPGMAVDNIRQLHDPLFKVTGGAMYETDGTTHIVFGQDFDGPYSPFINGAYTKQVRSFTIVDDGVDLSVTDATSTPRVSEYRRRDLNVIPVVRPDGGGGYDEELVALSGVFTPTVGAWTVPVEIAADGTPTMADPLDSDTFKQGMNGYHSAKLGLFSEATDDMHAVLFGGISLQYYDHDLADFVSDDMLPFINQVTSISIDADGAYTQHLLSEEFPDIRDPTTDQRLRFGANAEFMLAEGIETYANGVIKMDELSDGTTLGYIFGGIMADAGNSGNTAASGFIFAVTYSGVPEPSAFVLLYLGGALASARVTRRNRRCSYVERVDSLTPWSLTFYV